MWNPFGFFASHHWHFPPCSTVVGGVRVSERNWASFPRFRYGAIGIMSVPLLIEALSVILSKISWGVILSLGLLGWLIVPFVFVCSQRFACSLRPCVRDNTFSI